MGGFWVSLRHPRKFGCSFLRAHCLSFVSKGSPNSISASRLFVVNTACVLEQSFSCSIELTHVYLTIPIGGTLCSSAPWIALTRRSTKWKGTCCPAEGWGTLSSAARRRAPVHFAATHVKQTRAAVGGRGVMSTFFSPAHGPDIKLNMGAGWCGAGVMLTLFRLAQVGWGNGLSTCARVGHYVEYGAGWGGGHAMIFTLAHVPDVALNVRWRGSSLLLYCRGLAWLTTWSVQWSLS